MTKFSFTNYVNYFAALAASNTDIADNPAEKKKAFHMMDMANLTNAQVQSMTERVFILEHYEGSVPGVNDNWALQKNFSFMVLQKVDKRDIAEFNTAIEQTEQIGLQVLAKMQHDWEAGNTFFSRINWAKTNWYKVGPLFDEKYGWTFEMEVTGKDFLLYDPLKWQ